MPSGYEYEFVQEVNIPDDYICVICQCVMRKPVQTKCGHRFCRGCLDETNNSNPRCPVDRLVLTPQEIFEDTAWERKILSFKIKCPEQGCRWQGELINIENHDTRCDYKIVNCDNKDCNVRKPRQEMVGHVQEDCLYRIVSCVHCKNTYMFCKLEDHASECPQCPVSCPNNCEKIIKREEVANHTSNECSLTSVPCSYKNIGCNFEVKRKDLNDHIEVHGKQHLAIAVDKILSLENQIDEMKELIFPLIAQIQVRMNDMQYSFTWKVKDFSRRLERAKTFGRDFPIDSEPFYTHKYGYKLKLRLYPNGVEDGKGTHVSILLIVMRGEYDALLTWPFDFEVKFTLMDQKPSQRKSLGLSYIPSEALEEYNEKPTRDENIWMTIAPFVSHKQLATENYVFDGALFVKIEFQKLQQANGVKDIMTNDDENTYSFILDVEHFRQELETAKKLGSDRDYSFDSEPFYTHKYGYKLKVRLDPNGNGDGKGTHVSVFLVVMPGEYDALLTWPFDWKVKFILMDQKPNPLLRKNIVKSLTPNESCEAFQRPVTYQDINLGIPQFVSHELLAKESYILDDTLFLKLELEKP